MSPLVVCSRTWNWSGACAFISGASVCVSSQRLDGRCDASTAKRATPASAMSEKIFQRNICVAVRDKSRLKSNPLPEDVGEFVAVEVHAVGVDFGHRVERLEERADGGPIGRFHAEGGGRVA